MKFRSSPFLRIFRAASPQAFGLGLSLAGMSLVGSPCARAATYFWDGSLVGGTGNGASNGGSGTWSTTNANWDVTNGAARVVWGAANSASFGGATGGTVNLGSAISVNSGQTVSFATTGYTLAGAQTLSIAGTGNGLLNIGSSVTTTIGDGTNATIIDFTAVSDAGTRMGVGASGILNIAAGSTIRRSGAAVTNTNNTATFGSIGFNSTGTVNIAGTLAYTGSSTVAGGVLLAANASDNITVNVNNLGLVSSTGTANGLMMTNNATATATLNLNTGGTVFAQKVSEGFVTTGTSNFNFNGGTLKAAVTNNTSFMTGLDSVKILANGAIIDTNTFDVTIGQSLLTDNVSTGGGLTKSGGTGVLTLSGTNTYTGATNINVGTLRLNGSISSSTGGVAVNAGTTLAGTSVSNGSSSITGAVSVAGGAGAGTRGTITLVGSGLNILNSGALTVGGAVSGASQLNFDGSSAGTDRINLGANAFTVNAGGALITITPGVYTAGTTTYSLLSYGSTNNALGTGTTVGGLTLTNPTLAFGVAGTLNVTNTAVELQASAATASGTVYFSGAKGANWTDNDGTFGNFTTDQAGTSFVTALPGANADVIYAATGATNLANSTLGQDFSIKSLTFDGTAAAASIGGSNTLTVGTGGITVESGNGGATLGMTTIALGAAQTWQNNSANTFNVSSAITNGGNTLTVDGTGATALGGAVSGLGGLTKSGAGTLTLSAANTYTGSTTINAGTLAAGVVSVANTSGAFGNNSAVTLADVAGAAMDITGFNTQIGSLNGGGTTGGNVTLGAATLTVGGGNQTGSYAGIISGVGGALTKIGTGTQTFSGVNAYTGGTTLSRGTIAVGNDPALGAGALTINNTTGNDTTRIQSTDSTARTLANQFGTFAGSGATYAFGNTTGGTGNLTFTNTTNASIGTGARIFLIDNAQTRFDMGFTSTGSITKTGSGTMLLGGASTYSGGTTIANGTIALAVGNDRLLNTGSVVLGDSVANTSGKLQLSDGTTERNQTLAGLTTAGTGTDNRVVGGGSGTSVLTLNIASTNTYAGILGGPGTNENNLSLTKSGAGLLTLSASNSYTGGTTISAGAVAVGNSNALGTGSVSLGGTANQMRLSSGVNLGNNIAINSNTGTFSRGLISLNGGGTATLSGTITINAVAGAGGHFGAYDGTNLGSLNITGPINSASTPVTIRTAGVVLSGGGSYTDLQINENIAGSGVTKIGADNGISTSATVTISTVPSGTATLDLNGFNQTVAGLLRGAGTNAIVQNAAASTTSTLTWENSTTAGTFAGTLSSGTGTLALTKQGTASLTLSGTNTYTGATNVNAGTLVVNDTIGGSAVTVSNNGTTLSSDIAAILGSSVTMNSNTILAVGGYGSIGAGTVTNATTFKDGSIFSWDLTVADPSDTASTTAYDQWTTASIAGEGDASLGAIFNVVLGGSSFADNFWNASHAWSVFTTAAVDLSNIFTTFGGAGVAADGSVTGVMGGTGQFTFNGSNTLNYNFTAVPEPSSALAGILIAAGLMRRRRQTSRPSTSISNN
ncbi:MAG: autotransporter-associated beta strand repeat-containing protein [Verrucomicrobiota bacterium]